MPSVPSLSSTRSDLLPRSLPLLLSRRSGGCFQLPLRGGSSGNPNAFVREVARNFSPSCLVESPQILTPQTEGTTIHSASSTRAANSFSSAINSIHIDRVENRFLLAGGNDAIVSVYDLSKWGSEEYLSRTLSSSTSPLTLPKFTKTRHKPIASSQRELPRAIFTETESQLAGIEIPSGHASPISKVQWYPVDSGAFLSSSKDGTLLVWDTDSMTPVAQCLPFADTTSSGGIATFHLSHLRNYSAVVCSLQDPALKLVDIRSGASSHTLMGHANSGVSSVQWAPQNDVILASGGLDGTVRLWDIRKAGSRASLAILNQDITHPPTRPRPFRTDYSHLPKPSSSSAAIANFAGDNNPLARPTNPRKRSSATAAAAAAAAPVELAPNNYRNTENSTASSHSGPVTALSFVEQDGGNHLVSASQDGNIHIWDLRGNGHLLPLRFLAPGHQPAIQRNRKQVPLLLTSFGRNDTSTTATSSAACWVGNGSKLMGYSLDRGGSPHKVLQGHLQSITAIDVIEATMQLLTAGKDGMILTWGKPEQGSFRKRKLDHDCW